LCATLCVHNAPSGNAKNGKGHGGRSGGEQSESTKAENKHSQGQQTAPPAKKANPKHQTSAKKEAN